MKGQVEIVNAGIGNSIQDLGRPGYRHMGITASGSLDPILARCANALVGNQPQSACIEVRAAGPSLKVTHGRVRFAMTGELTATVLRTDGSEYELDAWRSISLDAGEELQIGYLSGGSGYIAVSGGLESRLQLGSRSTYQRAEIGDSIAFGLTVSCDSLAQRGAHEFFATPWQHDAAPIRIMLGPQEDHFTPEAISNLLSTPYTVSAQSDRMGMRLEGISLTHTTKAAADIISDGVTPGAIQVPANGQPIVLLADCQTVGGYPKVATVISADLPRLAQIKPGERLSFAAVTAEQARQALLDLENKWKWWACDLSYRLPVRCSSTDDVS